VLDVVQAAEQNNMDPTIAKKRVKKRRAPPPPNPFTGEVEHPPPPLSLTDDDEEDVRSDVINTVYSGIRLTRVFLELTNLNVLSNERVSQN
jgi:hypothetical protein